MGNAHSPFPAGTRQAVSSKQVGQRRHNQSKSNGVELTIMMSGHFCLNNNRVKIKCSFIPKWQELTLSSSEGDAGALGKAVLNLKAF